MCILPIGESFGAIQNWILCNTETLIVCVRGWVGVGVRVCTRESPRVHDRLPTLVMHMAGLRFS